MNLVAVVASGAEALTAVDRMPIDVALLDVEMPGVSGVETAAVIRREHPEVTVVMLTAFERPGRLDEAIAAGVHGFLTKDTPRGCQMVCVRGPSDLKEIDDDHDQEREADQRGWPATA